jgi:hypothetical protein
MAEPLYPKKLTTLRVAHPCLRLGNSYLVSLPILNLLFFVHLANLKSVRRAADEV